jgi:hypothetical protein
MTSSCIKQVILPDNSHEYTVLGNKYFYFNKINTYFDLCLLKVEIVIYYEEFTISTSIKYSMH